MSRQPRLNVADGVYHVTQRGMERRGIVLDDEDRHDWWRLFDRQATPLRLARLRPRRVPLAAALGRQCFRRTLASEAPRHWHPKLAVAGSLAICAGSNRCCLRDGELVGSMPS